MSKITRQQYMAELKKLLSFMFQEDRVEILKAYNDMLDNAEDEQAMLESFGSPTKLAVHISRTWGKEELPTVPAQPVQTAEAPDIGETVIEAAAGEEIPTAEEITEAPEAPVEEAPVEVGASAEEEAAVEPATPETPEEVAAEEAVTEEPSTEEVPIEEAELEDTPPEEAPVEVTPAEETPAGEITEPEPPAEEAEPAAEVSEPVELLPEEPKKKLNAGLLILYLIPAIPVGLALVAAALAVGLAVFCAGLVILLAGFKLFGFTFSGMQVLADTIICFGVTLGVLAVGLLLIWLAVWFIIVSVPGLISCVVRLGKKLCIREAEKNG